VAQQHLDPTAPTGEALAGYLRAQATEFLRALRLHRETGGATGNGTEDSVDAARALRRSVRRISGSLHTFRPLLETEWSESLQPELAWLSGTLTMEHAYAARLERLLLALHRLSGATVFPSQARAAVAAVSSTAAAGTDAVVGSRANATANSRADVAAGGRANAAAGSRAAGAGHADVAAGSRAAGAARVGAAAPRGAELRTRRTSPPTPGAPQPCPPPHPVGPRRPAGCGTMASCTRQPHRTPLSSG